VYGFEYGYYAQQFHGFIWAIQVGVGSSGLLYCLSVDGTADNSVLSKQIHLRRKSILAVIGPADT
jgi:hypothetical protein